MMSIIGEIGRNDDRTAVRREPASTSSLAFTPEMERELAPIYARLSRVMPAIEWPVHAPYIAAIQRLKKERNAVILAHNYQTPEIFHGVADYVGDSLGLAQQAAKTAADIIVQCGVHFMAETSKILSPEKIVLIPDLRAGCSLAASITGADVRLLRERYPGVPVVTYVNTSAEVKAEIRHLLHLGERRRGRRVAGRAQGHLPPDEYLGKWVATQTKVELMLWKGHCEVHERFTGARDPRAARGRSGRRRARPSRVPAGGPRRAADFVGSTAGMIREVGDRGSSPRRDDHRVLDERQRRDRASGGRVRAAVQPLPAHEADHAAQDPAHSLETHGVSRSRSTGGDRRAGAARGRADARSRAAGPSDEAMRSAGRRQSCERRAPTSWSSAPASPGSPARSSSPAAGRPADQDRARLRARAPGRRAASPPPWAPATRPSSTPPTRSRPAPGSSIRRSPSCSPKTASPRCAA